MHLGVPPWLWKPPNIKCKTAHQLWPSVGSKCQLPTSRGQLALNPKLQGENCFSWEPLTWACWAKFRHAQLSWDPNGINDHVILILITRFCVFLGSSWHFRGPQPRASLILSTWLHGPKYQDVIVGGDCRRNDVCVAHGIYEDHRAFWLCLKYANVWNFIRDCDDSLGYCILFGHIWAMMLRQFLVGGLNPSEKYESQLGWLFPIYGKIKLMFQTTNQSMLASWFFACNQGSSTRYIPMLGG